MQQAIQHTQIDLNSRTALPDRINWHIDRGIDATVRHEPRREYLGCSVLGGVCERAVQYETLAMMGKLPHTEFEPRIRRIFERGHDAEDRAAQWLRGAGFLLVTEDPSGNGQFAVEFLDGRVRGHADGLLLLWSGEGICPIPLPALWECKCLGAKYWNKARKEHIKFSHPQYFAQMQLYMGGLRLDHGLITLINADTMELHHELVAFDQVTFAGLINRAERILAACDNHELLPRCATTEAELVCRMCRRSTTCWSVSTWQSLT